MNERDGSELTSAISGKSTPEGVGNTARGGSATDEYFMDVAVEEEPTRQDHDRQLRDEQNRKSQIAKQNKGRGPIEPEAEIATPAAKKEQQDDLQGQEEEAGEEEEAQEQVVTDDQSDEGEVIEVEETEYDYLMGLDDESKIAYGLKHKKQQKGTQRRLSKVENVVGKKFIDLAVEDKIPKEVGIVINNLSDQAFQDHIAGFYDTHELRDGSYIKTKQDVPSADVLTKYSDLEMKRATVNVTSFMEGEDEFDATEAYKNPYSKSGIALSKFETEKVNIENELRQIREVAVQASDNSKPQDQSVAQQQQFDELTGTYPELKDETALAEFKEFIETNRPKALEVFYRAFKATGTVKKKTKKLILREIQTISDNKGKVVQPAKAKAQQLTKQKYDDPGVQSDAEFFGDYAPND